MRFTPRQCDLMIVAGRVVMKMIPVLQRIWLQMPEPKWCISMGACASSGGVFDTYAVVQGIDRFIPVDVYVPGCPPRPEQLLQSVLDIQDKVMRTGTITGKEFLARTEYAGPVKPQSMGIRPEDLIVAPGNFATATRQHREEPAAAKQPQGGTP
jgi:NADH-quinone oxidoreductase subunit B